MTRILIIQLCRLGDILQTTPMLRGLRREHPEAHITLVLHDLMAQAPVPSALVDRKLVFPYSRIGGVVSDAPQDWETAADPVREFLAEVGTEPYDLLLNISHNDISGLLSGLIPAREVRGAYIGPDRRRLVRGRWMTYFWSSQLWREQGCFNLVDVHNWMAGVASDARPLEVDIPAAAHASVERWLDARGLAGTTLIAVQLGASEERKRWPAERFAQAVNALPEHLGQVIFVGTTHERELFARAQPWLTRPVHDAIGETSLPELAALLSRCRVLLTNDTGTMHVASAAGARIVDVSVGPVFVHETGPYGEGHFVIEPSVECYPCTLGADCHHMACHDYPDAADVAALTAHALGAGPMPQPQRARIMTGRFTAGGHIGYHTVWPHQVPLVEMRRQASRRMWEVTLHAPGVVHDDGDLGVPGTAGSIPLNDFAGLKTVAKVARSAAALARRMKGSSPAACQNLLQQITAALTQLQFLGQTEVACQSIVAYLTIRLGAIVEVALNEVAAVYEAECLAAATRAETLARLLASTYDAARSGGRLAS